jgi:hypothetical protein
MRDRFEQRWRRRAVCVGALLYLAVLIAVPFEHHDLICHIKTPQHCTSCVSSPPGSHQQAPAAPGAHRLADVGRAVALLPSRVGACLTAGTAGRSPPPVA